MGETTKLISGLKSELKTRGLTYKDLAERLEISEPSVKRLFAEESFTLERFAKACEVIGTSISEILKSIHLRDDRGLAHLTLDQEEMLAADPSLFTSFHRLLHGASVDQIQKQLKVDASQMTRILVRLDKIGVIDLHPKNVIRIKTPRLIKWEHSGPLMQTYGRKVQELYFRDGFDGTNDHNRFLTGPLSEPVAMMIQDRIRKFTNDIEDMWDWDLRSKAASKQLNYAVLLSCKPWQW